MILHILHTICWRSSVRQHNFGSTSTKMREFIRAFSNLILLLILQINCCTDCKTSVPSCRSIILKQKSIFWAHHMERHMHKSPCTPVLPKWKRTKINSKKNCIFRFQSVASNAEEKKRQKVKEPAVSFPHRTYFLFSICIHDLYWCGYGSE